MANNSTLKKIQIDNVTYDIGGGASVAVQNNTALVINNSGTDTTEIANTIAANPSAEATESLNKIKIGDVVYVIESSQPIQPSGVTIYTLIPPCTAVPIDSTTMIENIYFNTSLSEAEVVSIIDNAFASIPGWLDNMGSMTYVFMNESNETMIIVGINSGMYIIQGVANNPDPQPEEAILFIGGPNANATGLGFTGWNPSFNGSLAINETNTVIEMHFSEMNMLNDAKQMNEALKELISSTPF
jgi:hypothetical protein